MLLTDLSRGLLGQLPSTSQGHVPGVALPPLTTSVISQENGPTDLPLTEEFFQLKFPNARLLSNWQEKKNLTRTALLAQNKISGNISLLFGLELTEICLLSAVLKDLTTPGG